MIAKRLRYGKVRWRENDLESRYLPVARTAASAARTAVAAGARTCGDRPQAPPTCCLSQASVTDFGRSIGMSMARFHTSWAHMPMTRDTEKSTV